MQVVESSGGLAFARVPVEEGEYPPELLVYPRHVGSNLESMTTTLADLTRIYTLDTAHDRDGCCATKKLSSHSSEMIFCGLTCVEGLDFCQQHRLLRTSNPTRIIFPEECEGHQFGVGHEVYGFFRRKNSKALSEAHLAKHCVGRFVKKKHY
jgi:hypothetical protein